MFSVECSSRRAVNTLMASLASPPYFHPVRSGVLILALGLALNPFAFGQARPGVAPNPDPSQTIVLPKSVPDPIEPVNRALWEFNKGLLTDVVKPTARVYRVIVPKPARRGIANLGTNVTYPARLMNNLLQGKWTGAGDETARFLCNTIVGFGGLFDVADKWKIPKSEGDFGQTLGQWGWKPHFYLMLPLYGPSNDRDTVGLAADTAANPLLYVVPYKFDAGNPLTYYGPYTYFSYTVTYNDLADHVDEYVRASQAQMD